ncbi:glycoside hydrolase/phage tail family protein [Aquamicrobium segne]|uniref:Glycoside hydrolase/phage tail family protein n=1 Tax=Aquamicrobium segne TaxID=469547 RepID=A0ABW0GUR3_9HYPH
MATILLQAAGAYLGGFLGTFGGAIGSAVGAMAGYVLDRGLINGTQRIEGPRLASARPFSAEEGASIPRLYGTARLGGTLIWATRFEERRSTRRQGKMGPKVTEYSYFANAAFLLCEGEIGGVRRIWADGREIDRETLELRVHTGSEIQPPDPLIEARQKAGNTPAYRGSAYVVIERMDLTPFGNRIPQLQFEVIKPVGALHKSVQAVALIPGATEYGLSTRPVTNRRRAGEQTYLNRNMLFAGTDIAASLDELQQTCPNLKHVALVVAWFGDDLRAGQCKLRPMTTTRQDGFSVNWQVSGLLRQTAAVVSTHDGGPAYGGTPSDRSVMEAIAEIRARGLKVTLNPFIMMDVPTDNTLADPYGDTKQAAYPWRGRISCYPGPLQPETADCTALSRAQVAAFCGSAQANQFSRSGNTISFSGGADWGYRRFILQYAHLAVAAGGVDAFLLGSELRGLTTLRDQTNAFPFVEQLATLAEDVRAVIGPQTQMTYAADWSEYFGHHPADGSGDVFFHLDPLWAHPAIDAVGIDNYMPLSDWRDADYAGGNPDGFAGPYDMHGLRAGIASGEGFDWYYPDNTARIDRAREEIHDGAYARPWVFRYKDILSWWANFHYDRPGGVENSTPTAWIPESKPVWFTELGCPAVDKGPNQPNAFPDPKSAESSTPYFSNEGRSDLAQSRFLEAHLSYWSPGGAGFQSAKNPLSPIYSERMVDPERIYLWAWDARPFPAFPQRVDLWSDGKHWSRGHWLNGRLSNPDIGALVAAILEDHGYGDAVIGEAGGSVSGYVIADPTTARAALEPLADLFDLSACEVGAKLIIEQAGAGKNPPFMVDELIVEDGVAVMETVRNPDHELPAEALLSFVDPANDYQVATVRRTRDGVQGSRQQMIYFPGVIEAGQAGALLDDWLRRIWHQRETTSFAIAQPNADILPGAIVQLPSSGASSSYIVTNIEDGVTRRVEARQIQVAIPAPWREAVLPGSLPAPILAGSPHVLFLDLPAALGGSAETEQFRIAAWQKPWRSQTVFASPESEGFVYRQAISRPAVLGHLLEPLPAGVEGRLTQGADIMVELFDADAQSVSLLQMLNGANVAAVRSATGAWEILQFRQADEVTAQKWRLSHLLRGQSGTTDAMLAGAPAEADFVLLDEAVVPAGLQTAEIGLELNWQVGPAAMEISDLHFVTEKHRGGLRAQMPLSPVHLKAKRRADDVHLSWIRRSRLDADSWEMPEIPLGESHEEYQVTIAIPDGDVVRTQVVNTQGWLYPQSLIVEDFGVMPSMLDLTVQQFGGPTGWGLARTSRLTII